MKTHLCFIRHGQTEWNKQVRIQGRINNPLNDNGREQARSLGQYLKTNNPNWDLIVSSPLLRAYETAQIIQKELNPNIPLITNDNFIEREFGKAEGENITKPLFDLIVKDEIEGLEKTKVIQNRVYNAVLELAEKYPGKKILIVAHSHVIKGLLTKLEKKYSFNDQMLNSALNFFTVENKQITIEGINISTHLGK